jgi:hypothetical protein
LLIFDDTVIRVIDGDFDRNQTHFIYWYARRNIFGNCMEDDLAFLALATEV